MYLRKHKNNTDVAMEIIASFYVKEKDEYSLKVVWWNIVGDRIPNRKAYCMNLTQRIRIPRETYKRDWEYYEVKR